MGQRPLALAVMLMLAACGKSVTAPSGATCAEMLPTPILRTAGKVDYGDFVNYRLSVTNWAEFADALFTPSPTLPPCGGNSSAARTWVDIFVDDGTRIYGYCALGSARALSTDLYLPYARARPQPRGAYIQMVDRLCNRTVTSNVAALTP